ncbi:hypothetical protein ACI2K4_16445 [Micromonospora sp. NPDC050397]|uniref:hypothetical protein n=1 Tax=Micromonospora sp. NPDC050397 TaxID=3364279 RepID=UPI00384EB182
MSDSTDPSQGTPQADLSQGTTPQAVLSQDTPQADLPQDTPQAAFSRDTPQGDLPQDTPPADLPQGAPAREQAIPQPARRWSPARKILIALAALVALALAATGGAYAAAPEKVTGAFGHSTQPSTSHPATTPPATGEQTNGEQTNGQPSNVPSAGSTAPGGGVGSPPTGPTPGGPIAGGAITVVAPATLGGRPRIGDESTGGTGMPDDSGVPEVTATARGIYGNAATQDIVIVTAVASTSGTPESRLSQFISGVSQELDVHNFTEADPGPLGGLARCGDGRLNGVPVAVCVWSDAGSAGALVRVLQSSPLFRADFPALRAEVERRA